MELVGSCVTAMHHVTALRWKGRDKKKGPRMSGSPAAITSSLGSRERGSWERGAVGIVREGRWAVRGCVAGLKRRLLRGLGG